MEEQEVDKQLKTESLGEFISKIRQDYPTRMINVVDGYEFIQYQKLTQIELYTNSRFVNGNTDSSEKLKPFYNITTRLLINQQSAEDIDTKDMIIETDYKDFYVQSFLLTKQNQRWMKEAHFAQTLNEMTEVRGKYGGVLVKKVETDDQMTIEVVDLISSTTDPVDIGGGIKIIEHFYTPAQLKEKEADGWENVDAIIAKQAESNQSDESKGQVRETFGDYIKVYEIHGVMPSRFLNELTEDEQAEKDQTSEYDYCNQIQIVAGLDWGKDDEDESMTLFAEREDENIFKYLPYRKVARRSLGWGVVEEAEESQMWTNDAVYREKVAMEFIVPVLQSPLGNKMAGKNIRNIAAGTVLKHTDGKQMTTLNLTPQGLAQFQNIKNSWDTQVSRATSTQEANTGGNMPSGTAYRLGALLNEEANKPFEKRREEMAIFLNEIYQDWIIPFHIKTLQNGTEMCAELSLEEMKVIDEDVAKFTAKKMVLDDYFAGKYEKLSVSEKWARIKEDEAAYQMKQKKALQKTKNKRYFGGYPDDYFEGAIYKLTINISNEQKIKAVYLETISNILTTVAQNPNILKDPVLSKLFDQIMESAGYSPVQLDSVRADVEALQQTEEIPQNVKKVESPVPETVQ